MSLVLLQLTDEGSPTTAITDTCANLPTSYTTTTIENSKGAKVLTDEEKIRGKESTQLTTTIRNDDKTKSWKTPQAAEQEEEIRESYCERSSTEPGTPPEKTTPSASAEKVETTTVTGSEAERVTKQSCDSALENNIISSKEFNPPDKTVTTMAATEITEKTCEPPFTSQHGVRTATASLTLENLDKMNKEIEIRPLKQEMSGAEEQAEKFGSGCSGTDCTSSGRVLTPLPPPTPKGAKSKEEPATQAKVTDSDVKTAEAFLTSSFLPSTSTSSSSCPSSTNESSTSSPVNGGTSLMRFQPKSASRKNLANEDDDTCDRTTSEESMRESCTANGTSGSNGSCKKKQKKNSQTLPNPANSENNGTKSNKGKSGTSPSDVPKNQKESRKRNQHESDNAGESNKAVTSNDTNASGRGSQDQTASTESGQQPSLEEATNLPPPESEGNADPKSLLNSSTSCTTGEQTPSIPMSSNNAIDGGLSRKPIDLTVQCPAAIGNEEGQYEAVQLQGSPSLANEPSSPDSLNTNQSVAGSEFAPGENLSVSESDLMNRTISIDEVEEDLPQEVEYATEHGATIPFLNISTECCEPTKISEGSSDVCASLAADSENQAAFSPPEEKDTTSMAEPSVEAVNVGHNVSEDGRRKLESGEKSDDITTAGVAAAVEEPIKSTATTTQATMATPPPSSSNFGSSEIAAGEGRDEVPLRPQSITLAVTEWLKTQGEDALTPIVIGRASSSDEFEGDVEETTDSDDEDYNDDDDVDKESRVRGRKDDNALNLEQNQKNVHGR